MIGQLPAAGRTGPATASLVLGIVGLVGCLFYGLPGVVCGLIAMYQGKKGERLVQSGEAPVTSLGNAKAGRIMGLISLILGSLFFLFMFLYFVFVIGIVSAAALAPPPAPAPAPTTVLVEPAELEADETAPETEAPETEAPEAEAPEAGSSE